MYSQSVKVPSTKTIPTNSAEAYHIEPVAKRDFVKPGNNQLVESYLLSNKLVKQNQ